MATIYEWECDVRKYEWLYWIDEFYDAPDPFCRPVPIPKPWRVNKLIRQKNPEAPERPLADNPNSRSSLRILSGRAVKALRDLLEPCCEILPLESDLGEYYAIHVLTIADCLDNERSNVRCGPNGGIIQIYEWSFLSHKIPQVHVFRLPKSPVYFLCTQTFVDRVQEHKLTGFKFNKLWSDETSAG